MIWLVIGLGRDIQDIYIFSKFGQDRIKTVQLRHSGRTQRAGLFASPSVKSVPIIRLSFNGCIKVVITQSEFGEA